MTKIKREKAQINFLQETHFSKTEHEKLKRFGYKNIFYSSHMKTCKREVAILISNVANFKCQKKIRAKEKIYIIVKGVIGLTKITLVNVYTPPDSDKGLFISLLDTMAIECEGICICGGDFNLIMDHNLDTTRKHKKPITKWFKNTM